VDFSFKPRKNPVKWNTWGGTSLLQRERGSPNDLAPTRRFSVLFTVSFRRGMLWRVPAERSRQSSGMLWPACERAPPFRFSPLLGSAGTSLTATVWSSLTSPSNTPQYDLDVRQRPFPLRLPPAAASNTSPSPSRLLAIHAPFPVCCETERIRRASDRRAPAGLQHNPEFAVARTRCRPEPWAQSALRSR